MRKQVHSDEISFPIFTFPLSPFIKSPITYSPKQLTLTRKKLEALAETHFPTKTTRDGGFYIPPKNVVSQMMRGDTFFPILIQSFDANVILNRASTMGVQRLLLKESPDPKLQTPPKTVFASFRIPLGDDRGSGILENLRPYYEEVDEMARNGVEVNGKTIPLTGYFLFPFPFPSLSPSFFLFSSK